MRNLRKISKRKKNIFCSIGSRMCADLNKLTKMKDLSDKDERLAVFLAKYSEDEKYLADCSDILVKLGLVV